VKKKRYKVLERTWVLSAGSCIHNPDTSVKTASEQFPLILDCGSTDLL